MFDIEGTDIKITRGDTGTFHIEILQDDIPYILKSSDILFLRVKKHAIDEKIYLEVFANRAGDFTILPEQTKDMFFGEYEYYIRLIINKNEVYSLIPVSKFTVLEEL